MVAVVGSAVVLALRAVRFWRTFRGFNESLTTALVTVTDAAAVTEARVTAVSDRTDRLNAAVEQLQESLARLRVLTDAAKDVRGRAAAVRRVIPKK